MQLWPAKEKALLASRSAASGRSASASTIAGVAFPSSSKTFFLGARSRRCQPTALDPVNDSALTRGSSTSASPIVAAGPVRTLSMPSGRPAPAMTSASKSALNGVWLAGLSTTAHPAPSAGASLWAVRFSGKLNGDIAPTTPTGRRTVNPRCPTPVGDASIGTTSPASRSVSAAACRKVEAARATSARADLMGLAASAHSVCANSSNLAVRAADVRSRTAARSCAGSGVAIAVCAASTAAKTSAARAAAAEPSGRPSYGDRTVTVSGV